MCNVYPKAKPLPSLRGLRVEPIESAPHMAVVIHDASGARLPGRFITNKVEAVRDRLLALEIDWTQGTEEVIRRCTELFTFRNVNWTIFQLYKAATDGQPHSWTTYDHLPEDRAEYLYQVQETKMAAVAAFIR